MKNLNVSVKLIVSFAIVIVLSVLVSAAGVWGMSQIKKSGDNIYYHNVTAMDALGSIRENFALQRKVTRDLVIFDAGSELYLEAEAILKDLEAKMDKYISIYVPTMNDTADIELFERFMDAYYNEYKQYKKEFLSHTAQDRTEAVKELIETQAGFIVESVSDILEQSHKLNVLASVEALRQNGTLAVTMRLTEIAVLLITILIVVLLVSYLTRLISTPLRRVSEALNHMGLTGDMTFDDETMRRTKEDSLRSDEIGMASRAIVNLLEHIWSIERAMVHISGGDFTTEVKTLSDRDTIGVSLAKVVDNLNHLFNKVREAEKDALAASKAKGLFLAHMSHEIRTPLNAIMGMSAIIEKSAGDKEKTLQSVGKIMSSSRHLLSIVNDVLDMAKIESGKFDLVYEPFSLKSSYEDVIGIITPRCVEKSIHFTFHINQTGDMFLIGDKTRLNQVLINLLGNAVKFTDDRGEVRFHIEISEETDKTALLKYTISDNGIGMSREQLSRLFQPFEQGSNATATQYGGTGLGLSISQNLVSMMGGTLGVESEPGKGSDFFFTLRFSKADNLGFHIEKGAQEADLRGKRVLLVEDIAINSEIIHELLSDTGIIIEDAENGQIAVDMFRRSPEGYYGLIFMDVQMPVMDGYEATRSIRALERGDAKTVPIIAMTANAYKEDAQNSLSAGMNGHLSKPVDLEAMLETLCEHLPNEL